MFRKRKIPCGTFETSNNEKVLKSTFFINTKRMKKLIKRAYNVIIKCLAVLLTDFDLLDYNFLEEHSAIAYKVCEHVFQINS